eukprot:3062588-Pyramimonas_sp.AAC.1
MSDWGLLVLKSGFSDVRIGGKWLGFVCNGPVLEERLHKKCFTGINWKIVSTYEAKRMLTNSPA